MIKAQKLTYTDRHGAQHVTLCADGVEAEYGVPLLDLSSLELPEEVEARLRIELWARGIQEYTDALQPGANAKIAAALRGAFKMAVSSIVTLCSTEHKLLTED